jgi:hypothetical protein
MNHPLRSGRERPGGRPVNEQLRQCPRCHALGYEHDLHCPQCGCALGPACRRCGAPVAHPIAFFCARCGERLEPDDSTD